ncbi:MAG: hypothetical protein AAGU14_06310 [Eubacteriaceae bacterium]
MSKYTKEEIGDALITVSSVISRCEKAQSKLAPGTPAHTLLKNRIKALIISKSLINNEHITDIYNNEELVKALKPICSIINKCEKARIKFEEGSSDYLRFENLIKAMDISKSLIEDEISKKRIIISKNSAN